jgi:hypothetical protein
MNTIERMFYTVLFFACFFIILSEPCYANPIAYNPMYEISWTAFAILLIAAPFVEAWIIVSISRDKVRLKQKLSRLFWVLFLINVITFIATQVLAYYIATSAGIAPVGYLAEILPLVVEYLILRWLFTKLHQNGMFPNPFSNKKVIQITLRANLVTFIAGIVLLLGLHYSWEMGVTPWLW